MRPWSFATSDATASRQFGQPNAVDAKSARATSASHVESRMSTQYIERGHDL